MRILQRISIKRKKMKLKHKKRVTKKASFSIFTFIITSAKDTVVFNIAIFINSDAALSIIDSASTKPAVIIISSTSIEFYYYVDIIIKFDAQFNQSPGFGFKGYKYAIVFIKLKISNKVYRFYLNTGCIISFINRKFLYKMKLKAKILTISTFIKIINVNKIKYFVLNYVVLELYFPAINGRLI